MSATKLPNVALPTTAPQQTRTYSPGVGETIDLEWNGTSEDVLAKYNGLVQQSQIGGIPGNNIRSVQYRNSAGRGSVVAQFARQVAIPSAGVPADVVVVEELMAVDIVRDVYAAPYFTSGTYVLTNDQCVCVRKAFELKLAEADIVTPTVSVAWASWSAGMKELLYHLLHGQESYYETGFVLRRSKNGLITSQIKEAFTNINTVVTAPTFLSDMDKLILALPSGEWLYRPPQAEYIGSGKWRITQEWHWAAKWSKIYGGSWGV